MNISQIENLRYLCLYLFIFLILKLSLDYKFKTNKQKTLKVCYTLKEFTINSIFIVCLISLLFYINYKEKEYEKNIYMVLNNYLENDYTFIYDDSIKDYKEEIIYTYEKDKIIDINLKNNDNLLNFEYQINDETKTINIVLNKRKNITDIDYITVE